MSAKYSVNTAVWLATAVMTMEIFEKNNECGIADIYFKQADIIKRAQVMADGKVDSARLSWWCCADHPKATQLYLRGDNQKDNTVRRLNRMNPKNEKTFPPGINMDAEVLVNGKPRTVGDVFAFVEDVYPEIINEKKEIFPEDIVWCICACYAFEHGKKKRFSLEDISIEREAVLNNAKQVLPYITIKDVESAIAKSKHSYFNYLVPVGKKVRVSFMQEFAGNEECPDISTISKIGTMSVNSKKYNLKDIYAYINKSYTESLRKLVTKIAIDYPEEEHRAWLLNWNPDNWEWTDYKEQCTFTKEGQVFKIAWSCSSKQPIVGDDVFLMKTGMKPRGIIAHGKIVTESYERPHYDPTKAEQGITSSYVDVAYDWIFDFETEGIIDQGFLKDKYPQQQWSPMASGIEINEPILTMLKEHWETLLSEYDDGYWPSLKEYSPGITKEKWITLLNNESVTIYENLRMFKMMLEQGGASTCANLAEKYGRSAAFYNSLGRSFAERVHQETGCSLCEDENQERFYTIPFVGRYVMENGRRRYKWKLRKELKEALESMDLSNVDLSIPGTNTIKYDKNMILYGPPGTGKTYNTAIYAVAICSGRTVEDVSSEPYSHIIQRYNELKKDGRIAFTTFHQSYGYEEFIEGIKPVLDGDGAIGYTIEDGVFKAFCKRAKIPEGFEFDHNAKIWKVVLKSGDLVQQNTVKFECFNEGRIMYDWKTQADHKGSYAFSQIAHFQERVNIGDFVVSYAGEGTNIDAIGIVTGDAEYEDTRSSYCWSRTVEWLETGRVHNIKELNGGKNFDNTQLQPLRRVSIPDLLKLIRQQTFVSQEKNYVFVIDEINRGNISKIFGELITLIEDTKREGNEEGTSALLPYSGEEFSVPDNVYILGTMNTADRSIALMDTALRRRFRFVEMMPDSAVLEGIRIDGLNVARMLDVINERIEFLFDREHTIGHAFFTGLLKQENRTVQALGTIFEKSVIPLLQEYFYEDYQKIQMVLGDNAKTESDLKFIKDTKVVVKNLFVGNIEDIIDLPEKKFEINTDAFYNIESYLGIAPGLEAE